MKEKEQIKIGEKYLAISVLGQIRLTAFKNKQKIHHKDPDYMGNGVNVWVNKKMEEEEDEL